MTSKHEGSRQRATRGEGWQAVNKQILTGLANPLRTEIQKILLERPASVNGISRELRKDYDEVRYEFKKLKEVGLITKEFERRVRGTVEVFYRAVRRPYVTGAEWPSVPDTLKGGLRGSLLELITDDAIEAIEADTFDSLESAHMSRTPGVVDDQGWNELQALLLQCLEEVIEIVDKSRGRVAAEGISGTPVMVSIMGYASATSAHVPGSPQETAGHLSDPGAAGEALHRSQQSSLRNPEEKAKRNKKKLGG